MSEAEGILLLSFLGMFAGSEPCSVKGKRHNLYCTLIPFNQSNFDLNPVLLKLAQLLFRVEVFREPPKGRRHFLKCNRGDLAHAKYQSEQPFHLTGFQIDVYVLRGWPAA